MTAEEWFIEGRKKARTREETIAFLQRIMDDERRRALHDALMSVAELNCCGTPFAIRANILTEARMAIAKLK